MLTDIICDDIHREVCEPYVTSSDGHEVGSAHRACEWNARYGASAWLLMGQPRFSKSPRSWPTMPDFYDRGRFTPDFRDAAQVWAYLAERGETLAAHEHLWTDWPWPEGLGDPHQKRSVLFVCEVPECIAVTTLSSKGLVG